MQCEICGRETSKTVKIIVDGSHLIACEACSSYGSVEAMPKTFFRPKLKPKWEEKSILEMAPDIVSGYGKKIKKAREKKGITIKQLAKNVFEKESFLHRIESETAKPSDKLAKKLERELGVKVIEKD